MLEPTLKNIRGICDEYTTLFTLKLFMGLANRIDIGARALSLQDFLDKLDRETISRRLARISAQNVKAALVSAIQGQGFVPPHPAPEPMDEVSDQD